ncbi:MAG: DUF3786 domain-containing protein [Clostridia bacterium]|nr:DUF3786 domain-containing protein [Clostridia bacterium]
MVQAGYAAAFAKAKKQLQEADPAMLAHQAGVEWDEKNRHFSFTSLGEQYTVSFPEGNVHKDHTVKAIPKFALLTLHYLLAKPVPPTGIWVSFKEIPGGTVYQTPFQNRTTGRLFGKLRNNPDLKPLVHACQKLSGEKITGGDMAFKFHLFPYIPLGLVCWKGDEEFPPSGNILFDHNANCFLATEDYAVLGEYLIEQLIANLPEK